MREREQKLRRFAGANAELPEQKAGEPEVYYDESRPLHPDDVAYYLERYGFVKNSERPSETSMASIERERQAYARMTAAEPSDQAIQPKAKTAVGQADAAQGAANEVAGGWSIRGAGRRLAGIALPVVRKRWAMLDQSTGGHLSQGIAELAQAVATRWPVTTKTAAAVTQVLSEGSSIGHERDHEVPRFATYTRPAPHPRQLLASWEDPGHEQGRLAQKNRAETALEQDHSDLVGLVQHGGEPLAQGLLQRMNRLLAHDFSHVRIHTDAAAARAAQALGVRAFAIGTHLYFAQGQFAPGTPGGDRLLVHELMHVVQFDQGRLPASIGKTTVSRPDDAAEQEARRAESSSELARAPAKLPSTLGWNRPTLAAATAATAATGDDWGAKIIEAQGEPTNEGGIWSLRYAVGPKRKFQAALYLIKDPEHTAMALCYLEMSGASAGPAAIQTSPSRMMRVPLPGPFEALGIEMRGVQFCRGDKILSDFIELAIR
jgi:Domain of unknown function (DUF4157)